MEITRVVTYPFFGISASHSRSIFPSSRFNCRRLALLRIGRSNNRSVRIIYSNEYGYSLFNELVPDVRNLNVIIKIRLLSTIADLYERFP